jgi:hypothetical protein
MQIDSLKTLTSLNFEQGSNADAYYFKKIVLGEFSAKNGLNKIGIIISIAGLS